MNQAIIVSGVVLDEHFRLSLVEVCRLCDVSAETVIELVNEGVVEIQGSQPQEWIFDATAFQRLKAALRLERDLGINPAGAALALDLLEELQALRQNR